MSEPATNEPTVEQIKDAWLGNTCGTTHWCGCWVVHSRCAMAFLITHIEQDQAKYMKLAAVAMKCESQVNELDAEIDQLKKDNLQVAHFAEDNLRLREALEVIAQEHLNRQSRDIARAALGKGE